MRFRRPPFSKASVYIWPSTRKRSSKREVFKNGGLQKRFWTWRLLKTKVYRSCRVDGENEGFSKTRDVIIICMPDFHAHQTRLARVYGFWTPSMRIRTKKSSVHSKNSNKNASLDLPFQCLVWTAENDVKRLVWTRIFLSVFWDPEVFENGLVWMGLRLSLVKWRKIGGKCFVSSDVFLVVDLVIAKAP